MSTSFKKPQDHDSQAFARYTTPSPPPQWAKEPLSPLHSTRNANESTGAWENTGRGPRARAIWAERTGHAPVQVGRLRDTGRSDVQASTNGTAQSPTSAMDAFASIALATSPTFDSPSDNVTALKSSPMVNFNSDSPTEPDERPWKRARSEALHHKKESQFLSRPATSHTPYGEHSQLPNRWNGHGKDEQSHNHGNGRGFSDSSTDDAELLLNVSRAAFLSNEPQPLNGYQPQKRDVNGTNTQRRSPFMRDGTGPTLSSDQEQTLAGTAAQAEPGSLTIGNPAQRHNDINLGENVSAASASNDRSVTEGAGNQDLQESPKSRKGRKGSKRKPPPTNKGAMRGKSRGAHGNGTGRGRGSNSLLSRSKLDNTGFPVNNKAPRAIQTGRSPLHVDGSIQRRKSMSDLNHDYNPLGSSGEIIAPAPATLPQRRRFSDSFIAMSQRNVEEIGTLGDFNSKDAGPSQQIAICAGCEMIGNSIGGRFDNEQVSWIGCDACKKWFHYACAGFASEKEVRGVDKYICSGCKKDHGPTTYLRKSSRAHTAIDYAGLNEGVVKTSDDTPEHPYIAPIKEGTIKFLPENFARMRPELITRDFFEKGNGMKEPLVIPAWMNPQQKTVFVSDSENDSEDKKPTASARSDSGVDTSESFTDECRYEEVQDDGQDILDMVIPKDLTVRRVADLYGPDEKVDVINVKSQGEDGRWKMSKWADYYESTEKKFIRNVISLEVSTSKLGRLVKRPRLVRDMDLVDSVWPAELKAKGDIPKVQLYCLMSVADSYTDFHIDFGGSSVFYHILKGKKTFFFIPPKSKHLKKYEQWCLSPAQNQTFLPDQTKECYRVDLSEGDTMMIPSGWIHAVWTPEDSLVIGGNFLTRLHYAMQIQIAEIEKTTKVPRKFRHPHFQRVLWFTAIRYLQDDPIPEDVTRLLGAGEAFQRETPPYHEFDQWSSNSKPGPENWQTRYYSQHELEGLPHLVRFLLRTALIHADKIEGITVDTRQRVSRAIPKGHGDPLDLIKQFAMWVAWKRGNEQIPSWAFPGVDPGGDASLTQADKKALSARAVKKMEREATMKIPSKPPQRQSERQQAQAQMSAAKAVAEADSAAPVPAAPQPSPPRKRSADAEGPETGSPAQRQTKVQRTESVQGQKHVACDECRKRQIGCKHSEPAEEPSPVQMKQIDGAMDFDAMGGPAHSPLLDSHLGSIASTQNVLIESAPSYGGVNGLPTDVVTHAPAAATTSETSFSARATVPYGTSSPPQSSRRPSTAASSASKQSRGKACDECRKSKRRCVHDENGNVDPMKVQEAKEKRLAGESKRRRSSKETGEESSRKKSKADSHDGASAGPLNGPYHSTHPESQVPFTSKSPADGESIMPFPQGTSVKRESIVSAPGLAMAGLPLGQSPIVNETPSTEYMAPGRQHDLQPDTAGSADFEQANGTLENRKIPGSSSIKATSSPDVDNDSQYQRSTPPKIVNGLHEEAPVETTPPPQKLPSPPTSPRSKNGTSPPSVPSSMVAAATNPPQPAMVNGDAPSRNHENTQVHKLNGNVTDQLSTTRTKSHTANSKTTSRKPHSAKNSAEKAKASLPSANLAVVIETKPDQAKNVQQHHHRRPSTSSPMTERERAEDESWKAAKLAEFSLRKRRAVD